MTTYVIANNVNTQLASAISSASTTIALSSAANLPTLSAGQIMPLTLNDASTGLNYEIVYVTAISGSSLTVTRAQEGTSALNWNVGDYAYCAFTVGTTAVSTGNPSNTFQVAPGTASQHAVQLGQALGLGQSWTVLTGSRAAGTTYTNSTSKPIFVMATVSIASGGTASISVNGVVASTTGGPVSPGMAAWVGAVVPPGQSYVVSLSGTPVPTLTAWAELR
ncbi:hypothetical protein HHL24_17130 [Paraburkholderia sp. RP-4-7]|uniref:Phage tail protein n=1 Tax=Paraburkholderia polaris TaxID=2728848 RepID=A0A848IEQ5_9BURK|nr:hypothetical protein [Paraburkholderia polaris]NML99652.1 hypothetical protein [Paraburkholderia polaris]